MKTITLNNTNLSIPEIGMGCMRIVELENADAVKSWVDTALENGINFFDHADIYGKGRCEELFGQVLTPSLREKIILQSKCSIRPGIAFDFSKEHILNSVDGILKRLNTEYLDILLLHRPDALMEPEEVADAFRILKESGKVRHFGVSNQTPMQMELLSKYCDEPLLINQLQLSIAHCPMINSGINANMYNDSGINRDGGVLEYCRLKDITIQAWSPFQYGMFEGIFLGNEKFAELNKVIDNLAEKYNVTNSAIAVAWILRHPAGIQTIVGTTNKDRIAQISKASEIRLTREEWYALYMAAGNKLP
ncbi:MULTISPECIES: aldo/keto reductase [Clostridia]|uniref:aldo/keto reductase n=1 Tax=Clostridia TaxID=186801 RepID=UPI000EB53571|nr:MULTISPECIES: aldo/keto reductase [Clostridia]RKQ29510.1 aldo/keto reductase family oxidoreductase [Ruminococcus sp. B05]TAP32957.1 aldo/keto reductase family oxidoreductase [Mediterraneibacter sp. gm002]